METIHIQGARVHNLKNIETHIPKNQLIVLTGPSGSGKSSLAFDTLYAEGQRRYLESLSHYARQFMDSFEKPDVDLISGLSPTLSIEQKTTSEHTRSTVGTVTEIYDFLRLLFARLAQPFCWNCQKPIQAQSTQQILDQILMLPVSTRFSLYAPLLSDQKGEHQKLLSTLREKGFTTVRLNGQLCELSEELHLDQRKKHTLWLLIDRLILQSPKQLTQRLKDSTELALKMGQGSLILQTDQKESLFATHSACLSCHVSYPIPEPRTFSFNSPVGACTACQGLGIQEHRALPIACSVCQGARLKKESLSFQIQHQSIAQLSDLSLIQLHQFLSQLKLSSREKQISQVILQEICQRLEFLIEVGIGYLSLSRRAQTLSGGESQRMRLATQMGSSLVDVIYILDEPSIGLHARDHSKLMESLKKLRDLGNTVLVVEHDHETMEQADWILDFGPQAGTGGGYLMAEGTPETLLKSSKSLTARYLRNELKLSIPHQRRHSHQFLTLQNAQLHHLKNLKIDLPLGTLIGVAGVSGSGKSSLIMETLYPELQHYFFPSLIPRSTSAKLKGMESLDKVIAVDQSPIGKTPRSNPATYIGLLSLIRDLFAHLPEAQIRGYRPGDFSFNVPGGRCEACSGDGMIHVKMHFLPDVYIPCEHCQGKRFQKELLEVRYQGKNIADILAMTAEEAYLLFQRIPALEAKLKILKEVGLGYLTLGQSSTTLSGGECQRIQLAKELSKRSTGRTIYILDEPSTGLHFHDLQYLITILQTLVDQGNTVILIEHHLDLLKICDFLIELGPEGGEAGGYLLATGTPEQVANHPKSITGPFLKKYLNCH